MAEFSGRRLQRVPGTRVEPAPNSEYAPISEMCLITRDYGVAVAHSYCMNSWCYMLHKTSQSVYKLLNNNVGCPYIITSGSVPFRSVPDRSGFSSIPWGSFCKVESLHVPTCKCACTSSCTRWRIRRLYFSWYFKVWLGVLSGGPVPVKHKYTSSITYMNSSRKMKH